MARIFEHPEELLACVGEVLGESEWITVEQSRIDQFAEATGDHQWIHVDPLRAASGPYGTCIAHGYLTLSLAPVFVEQVITIEKFDAAVNYGLNKVRFPAPVPVGSRVRATVELASAQAKASGVEAVYRLTYEVEGGERPACVAEMVVIYR